MDNNTPNLDNLIKGFKLSCEVEVLSPTTIKWYISFLTRFRHYLAQNHMATELDQVESNHIRYFIRYLQTEARTPRKERPLSPATVHAYVRSLKSFFSWLQREDYVNNNPMAKIPLPKAPAKVIDTFTPDQIARLVDLCRRSNGVGYRNLSILLLLLDSGVRVAELADIDLEDLNLAEGHIKIRRAKGGKERIVPIGSLVQKSLWKYINHFRPSPLTPSITRLFLNANGLPLAKNGIQQMMRRLGKRANISGVRCSPHTFRHTFAKNYLLNGGDIFSLQRILGHSSLASVRIYLNLFATDIKKQHQRFSPVDNLTQISSMNSLIYSSNSRNQRRRS